MAKNVSVTLELNANNFRKNLSESVKQAQEVSKTPIEIPVKIDSEGATKGLRDARGRFIKQGQQTGAETGNAFADGFTKETSNLGEQLKKGLSGSLENVGSAITGGIIGGGVAQGVQAVTTKIVEGFQFVIDKGSEFQSSLASLSAVTGVSGSELDKFGDKAKELAAKFGGSANDQISSFQTILSKFGPDLAKTPEALNTVTESVNTLAKASGLDASEAVNALSNSMLQFGVDASDPAKLAQESSRYINVLAASAKVGAAEIPQVAEAVLQAGVAAKGANLSFEETNAAIQALAVGGKVGSEAGVSLRNVLGLLIKQSGPGEKALAGVGLSVKGLGETLTSKGLAAALDQLQGGINKLGTDAEKAAFKATLFGTENASAAGILLDGVKNIKEFTKGVTGTTEATTAAQINMNTFSEGLSRFKANLENVSISIFEGFTKAFAFIADAVSGTVGPAIEEIGGYFERVWSIVQPVLALIGGAIIAGIVNSIQVVAVTFKTVYSILNQVFDGIIEAFRPIVDAFKNLFGPDGAASEGVDVVQVFSNVLKFFGDILSKVGEAIGFIAGKIINFLLTPLRLVGQAVAAVINFFGQWIGKLNNVQTTITVVVEKIGNLVRAIADFDLGKIKDALLDFGNISKDVQTRVANATAQNKKASDEQTKSVEKSADAQAQLNTEIKNQPDSDKKDKDADAAKKLAEELKKAKEALADLNAEQEKQKELDLADAITSTEERELARLEIERKYREKALIEEKSALESTGKLREAQEAVIQKKIEILNQSTLEKKKEIEGRAILERIKQEEDAQKLLDDVTIKFAEERAKKLRQALESGDVSVATDLIKTQRKIIEEGLSNQIDAIIESSPQYKTAAKELARQLEEGLLNEAQFKESASKLRTSILTELQSLPANTTDAYAQKIRLAYAQATNAILDQTGDILAKVADIQKKNKLPAFADSLINLGSIVQQIDFAGIFGKAAEETATLRKEQEDLVQAVKNGEMSYQDAIDKLGEVESQINSTNSATLEALSATFNAFAQQQKSAFDTTQNKVNEYLSRNQQIAEQIILLEQQKNEKLKTLREDDLEARLEVERQFTEAKDKLTSESTENTKKANDLTSASYANLAASAAASFTGMVLSGENALKALVVAALDALQALVPVLVAQITGVQLASPNPLNGLTGGAWALAGAAALSAVLYGLVAAAKSAVMSGFKEGGFTGNIGTSQVAGFVHGQEFVSDATTTKKHRALLEHLHSGRSLESFPALQKMLVENQIMTIPITEMKMIRTEIQAMRQTLDRMPNGISNKVGVDVNVGMDTYLYETKRSRMKARNLRG